MIDHLLGRPSTRLKRLQVLLVLGFWGLILRKGPPQGPRRVPYLRRINEYATRFSPWQIFVFALTTVYAIRHLDALGGFGAPEPLARMYSRSFYRTTWIITALDAGFASAMPIKPQWVKDIASIFFSLYYVIYANEADEKLRRYRAFCTIEMMRTTWHKTTNPYIRAFGWFHRASLPIANTILLPRPSVGAHNQRPTRAWIFYAKSERELQDEDELIVDYCGGGFVCMDPRHHEERLRQMAKETGKPVLAVDYCKAPEYPYPYALEECYDLYRSLFESGGCILGMSGKPTFRVILSGDSAGGNLAAGVMIKILEYPQPHIKSAYAAKAAGGPGSAPPALPRPLAIVLNYPSLNFAYTSWMKPEFLNVLRQQSEVNLQNLVPKRGGTLRNGGSALKNESKARPRRPTANRSYVSLAGHAELHLAERAMMAEAEPGSPSPGSPQKDAEKAKDSSAWLGRIEVDDVEKQYTDRGEDEMNAAKARAQQQKLLQEATEKMDLEYEEKQKKNGMVNTRLTMTSMAGYFQDRILTQSMMRAMAILYIGPRRQPDFDNDYYLSPIVAPPRILAEFPPILFTCGEKDPICDDTVVMAGRIRQAKLARQQELKRRGARFGEQLRMSGSNTNGNGKAEEMEDVDDWVQMRIIEGWSHGYLQMSSLLPEAKTVISFLSNWMAGAFEDYNDSAFAQQHQQKRNFTAPPAVVTPKKDTTPPISSQQQRRVVSSVVPPNKNGPKASSSDEEDDDEPLSFTPKGRRSPSLNSPRLSSVSLGSDNAVMPTPGSPILKAATGRVLLGEVKSRPSSFSGGEVNRDQNGINSISDDRLSLPPNSNLSARRRRSADQGAQSANAHVTANLVKESNLLERRRQDTMAYMGGATSEHTTFDSSAVEDSSSGSDD